MKRKVKISDSYRPRTIVTTDGECDDQNSFIHMLLCLNHLDLRGIVATSSCYHYAGDEKKGVKPYRWAGTKWLDEYIDAYGSVYENLHTYCRNYPSPKKLHSICKVGNIKWSGEMDSDSDGSRLIEEELLNSEDTRLFIQCWGGSNTAARALKSIEERYRSSGNWPEIRSRISSKAVLYLIGLQDDTYEKYIRENWPEIDILLNKRSYEALAFNWKRVLRREQKRTMYAQWQLKNILHRDNPLMNLYYTYYDGKVYEGELPEYQYGVKKFDIKKAWRILTYHGGFFCCGDFLSEGDSPAFLFLLDDELENRRDFEMENWGGSFKKVREHYYVDENRPAEGIGNYITEINVDFAKRIRCSEGIYDI